MNFSSLASFFLLLLLVSNPTFFRAPLRTSTNIYLVAVAERKLFSLSQTEIVFLSSFFEFQSSRLESTMNSSQRRSVMFGEKAVIEMDIDPFVSNLDTPSDLKVPPTYTYTIPKWVFVPKFREGRCHNLFLTPAGQWSPISLSPKRFVRELLQAPKNLFLKLF